MHPAYIPGPDGETPIEQQALAAGNINPAEIYRTARRIRELTLHRAQRVRGVQFVPAILSMRNDATIATAGKVRAGLEMVTRKIRK
jgi:hypothetical protein